MSEQMKNINCRVCLRYDLKESLKCFSLFDKYNNSQIAEKIRYVADIGIREDDGLPGKICPDCLLQLETAFEFKQKCVTSNKILLLQIPSALCELIPVKKELVVVDTDDHCSGSFVTNLKKELITLIKENVNQNFLHESSLNEVSVIEKSENNVPFKNDDEGIDTLNDDTTVTDKTPEENLHYTPDLKHQINRSVNVNDNYRIRKHVKKITAKEKCVENLEVPGELVKKSRAIDLGLICDDCGGSFKSKCKLSVHWKKEHLASKLICINCKRTFKTFKALHVHKKKTTRSCSVATKVRIEGLGKSRLFHCPACNYHTKNIKDMDAHLATHSGDRRFQCKDCLKCFTQHSSLQGHRETHHKDYRVEATCHYCGKLIRGRGKYYKHLLTHEPKKVECEVCKKIFKSRSSLLNHMKRHSGFKSYTCEVCSANFYTTGELCNHRKRVHFKAKTFKCDMCQYSSYTAKLLTTHRAQHTQDNVPCLICGMFLDNAEKLAIHQKRHNEKKFCCPHLNCEKGFFHRDSLRKHMVKKHGLSDKQGPQIVKVVNIKQEHSADNKFRDVITLSPILS